MINTERNGGERERETEGDKNREQKRGKQVRHNTFSRTSWYGWMAVVGHDTLQPHLLTLRRIPHTCNDGEGTEREREADRVGSRLSSLIKGMKK